MSIDKDLQKELEQPLPKDAVKTRRQGSDALSYVEGWYAIDQANKVFGFDGWNAEVREQAIVADYERAGSSGKNRVMVARATVRVTALGVFRDGVGIGICDQRADNPATGIEKAFKEAETDGIKRALRTFGYRFGLALYDKAQEHVGGSAESIRLRADLDRATDDALEAWWRANVEAVEALPADEKADVTAAFVGRRRVARHTAALARLRAALPRALDLGEVVAAYYAHLDAIREAASDAPDEDALMRAAKHECVARLKALEVSAASTAFGKAAQEYDAKAAAEKRAAHASAPAPTAASAPAHPTRPAAPVEARDWNAAATDDAPPPAVDPPDEHALLATFRGRVAECGDLGALARAWRDSRTQLLEVSKLLAADGWNVAVDRVLALTQGRNRKTAGAALKAAVEALEPKPTPPTGTDAPANDAPAAATGDAREATPAQGAQASAEWEAHLATKPNPFAVHASLAKRAAEFRAAGVLDARTRTAMLRVQALIGTTSEMVAYAVLREPSRHYAGKAA